MRDIVVVIDPSNAPVLTASDFARLQVRFNTIRALWGLSLDLTLRTFDVHKTVRATSLHAVVYGQKRLSVPDALGYHTITHAGLPYGIIGEDVCAEMGVSYLSVLAHEVFELAINPRVDQYIRGPHPSHPARTVLYPRESCDPVQEIADAEGLSACLTPAWFVAGTTEPCVVGGATPADGGLAPFTLAPGGYVRVIDPHTGRAESVFADARAEARWAVMQQWHPDRRAARFGLVAD